MVILQGGYEMTEPQVRYRLQKLGYALRKKGTGYMIVEPERNLAVAGGEGNGYSMSLNEVADFCDE